MYAVIETGGKQYRVQEGDIVRVEKLDVEEGEKVGLSKVLLISKEDGVVIGKPYIEGARVEATVLEHGKGKKIVIFKYKPKKNYRKKQGHRQPYTKIKIEKIVG
ncbi:MAG TPA: 50S ribosomal protein L21 [Tissierellia bacterium]|nr:50S ribosomal protein L21 [Tissierellia bacterium]